MQTKLVKCIFEKWNVCHKTTYKNIFKCLDMVFYVMCVEIIRYKHCTLDIDECIGNACGDNAVCINTPGSFDCRCVDGFLGNPFTGCFPVPPEQCGDTATCPCSRERPCPSGSVTFKDTRANRGSGLGGICYNWELWEKEKGIYTLKKLELGERNLRK